jgi:hypothetical protein
MASLQCHFCGAALAIDDSVGRSATCEACGKDLRCCINCRHHDTRYNNACTEAQADPVQDKARGNFCEYFYFSRDPFKAAPATGDRAADARAKLESLFGSSGTPPPAGPRSLADLFKQRPSSDERRQRACENLDALFEGPPADDGEE